MKRFNLFCFPGSLKKLCASLRTFGQKPSYILSAIILSFLVVLPPQPAFTQLVKSWENALVLYTLSLDEYLYKNDHTSVTITSLAISPDSQTLAIGSHDYERSAGNGTSTVSVWNLSTGQMKRILFRGKAGESFEPSTREPGFSWIGDIVNTIAFSPDGQTLAAGLSSKTIKLWNWQTGVEIASLKGHTNAVHALTFSPNGETLASGSSDTTIKLWNTKRARLESTLALHKQGVDLLAISPDAQILASKSENTIKLWSLAMGKLSRTINDTGETYASNYSLIFSRDGKTLASTCSYSDKKDTRICLKRWDVATGRAIPMPGDLTYQPTFNAKDIRASALSPDGQTLVTYVYIHPKNQVKMWDLLTGRELLTINDPASIPFTFSPDGQIFVVNTNRNNVQVWVRPKQH